MCSIFGIFDIKTDAVELRKNMAIVTSSRPGLTVK